MSSLNLHSLLGDRYPEATFHDSEIDDIRLEFAKREARFSFMIPIGSEARRLVFQRGVLKMSGLHAFAAETPKTLYGRESDRLWVTWDGPLPDPALKNSPQVPSGLPESAFCHCFFISSTNSYLVVAAEEADFVWQA